MESGYFPQGFFPIGPQNSQKCPRNVSWEISGVFHLFPAQKKTWPFFIWKKKHSPQKSTKNPGTFESIDADLKEGAASVDEQEAANRHTFGTDDGWAVIRDGWPGLESEIHRVSGVLEALHSYGVRRTGPFIGPEPRLEGRAVQVSSSFAWRVIISTAAP